MVGVLRDLNIAQLYWHLRVGAQRCMEAADIQERHVSSLADLLGPAEALAQHATSRDMELMLNLRKFFPDWLPVRAPSAHNKWCHSAMSVCTNAQSGAILLRTCCWIGSPDVLNWTILKGLIAYVARWCNVILTCKVWDAFCAMHVILRDKQLLNLQVSRTQGEASPGLHGHASLARSAVAALQKHCTVRMTNMWDYEPRFVPNGLVELAACLTCEQTCVALGHGEAPEEGVRSGHPPSSGTAGHRAVEHKDAVPVGRQADAVAESKDGARNDHLSRVLNGSDPTLVLRLRLKARLHLEVLRVMSWCFFMLGTEYEQQTASAKRKPLDI